MIEKAFCDLESSKILKEIGYDEWATYVWKRNTRFSNEIIEKYPGLSDCGYMDLEKKYGGPYTEMLKNRFHPFSVECEFQHKYIFLVLN